MEMSFCLYLKKAGWGAIQIHVHKMQESKFEVVACFQD